MRFVRPRDPQQVTQHLFVSNCGPDLGLSAAAVKQLFAPYSSGDVIVHIPYEKAGHVYVTLPAAEEAATAIKELSGKSCGKDKNRTMKLKYADVDQGARQAQQHLPVMLTAEQANISGLQLHLNFITEQQEQALLQQIDSQSWSHLAKRRVQHYGYKFEYSQRGVDSQQKMGPLPEWLQPLLLRMEALPDVLPLDQLTVNEYAPGVGLSSHIDTHSAFSGAILSLSLGGGCAMEFRRPYSTIASDANGTSVGYCSSSSNSHQTKLRSATSNEIKRQQQQQQRQQQHEMDCFGSSNYNSSYSSNENVPGQPFAAAMQQVVLYLPPRSLLVLGGEARYAWQHYIPHRKTDWMNGQQIPRAARRVSLTFRQVRGYPCTCVYPEYCDSQLGQLPPTRLAQLQQHTVCDESQQQQQQQQQQHHAQQEHGQQHGACIQLPDGPDVPDQQVQQLQQQLQEQQQQQPSHTAWLPCSNGSNGVSNSNSVINSHSSDAEAAAEAMERLYVHQVYDTIAAHFSSTRFAVWPKVRAFLESLPLHSVVADVGCGNGKYFGVRRDLAVLGSDRSAGLAAVAAQRLAAGATSAATGRAPVAAAAADVLVCDGLALPYKPCSCDAVLCIAVLHHINSRQRRVRLLQQLADVIVPGGKVLVTVWATDQEEPEKTIHKWKKIEEGQQARPHAHQQQQQQETTGPDYLVPWHLPFHRAGALAAAAQQSQGEISSKKQHSLSGLQVDQAKGAVVLQRYYHLFEQWELEGLIGEIAGVKIVDGFYDRSNWCAVFQKAV